MTYYVPDATIYCFSPQTYCLKNPHTALLSMSSYSIALTLACCQVLHFPYQDWNDLLIMLTTTAIDSALPKSSSLSKASDQKLSANLLHLLILFDSRSSPLGLPCLGSLSLGSSSLGLSFFAWGIFLCCLWIVFDWLRIVYFVLFGFKLVLLVIFLLRLRIVFLWLEIVPCLC